MDQQMEYISFFKCFILFVVNNMILNGLMWVNME